MFGAIIIYRTFVDRGRRECRPSISCASSRPSRKATPRATRSCRNRVPRPNRCAPSLLPSSSASTARAHHVDCTQRFPRPCTHPEGRKFPTRLRRSRGRYLANGPETRSLSTRCGPAARFPCRPRAGCESEPGETSLYLSAWTRIRLGKRYVLVACAGRRFRAVIMPTCAVKAEASLQTTLRVSIIDRVPDRVDRSYVLAAHSHAP